MRIVILLLVAACHHDTAPADLYFAWDDRRVLCSDPIDDLTGVTRNWTAEEGRFADAEKHDWVTMVHAHIPGTTVSTDALERIFGWADTYNLDYVRFDELVPDSTPRPGLAFAFDDDAVDAWYALRPMFAAHHARLTFFITRWQDLTANELAELKQLSADGHDLEPHTVHHLNAVDYVAAHGLDGYLADEVLPSIQVMADAGYHATSFAYPFGVHDDAIDAAVLQHVDRVRTTPGECP
jgi:peptidoglycan/xylan/chitin deacetylase (PgdA/CDA1 family)